ncbi:MAG: response regulator transcription factor [Gammaproteobacteria bacterium]|nr:response regulator transcription factor [Gammaproteobacteria bacterium]MBU1646259.1 response regulator transcription factor [Gammaproteobacteria bacterium]MBU1971185.1 response regulator transcription factor [Gammaproteobacteria bacterium]
MKRRKVLLVDGSATFREIFMQGMIERRFEPTVVASSGEAMRELADQSYDLICSAMHLPDIAGTALCATLRRDPRFAATPFFLFTADADVNVQQQVLPEGVTEVFHRNEVAELFNFIAHYPFDDRNLSGRILLVEDDAALRALVTGMLQRHGLQVVQCTDADAAWPVFELGSFDLVITDVVLTGQMTGLQLVRRIRRFMGPRGETPILAMTGFEDVARRLELFRSGINDYIAKPLLEQEFMSRVNNLLLARRSVWTAIARDCGGRLRDIRGELDALLASGLAPAQRQHALSASNLAQELERTLAESEAMP